MMCSDRSDASIASILLSDTNSASCRPTRLARRPSRRGQLCTTVQGSARNLRDEVLCTEGLLHMSSVNFMGNIRMHTDLPSVSHSRAGIARFRADACVAVCACTREPVLRRCVSVSLTWHRVLAPASCCYCMDGMIAAVSLLRCLISATQPHNQVGMCGATGSVTLQRLMLFNANL